MSNDKKYIWVVRKDGRDFGLCNVQTIRQTAKGTLVVVRFSEDGEIRYRSVYLEDCITVRFYGDYDVELHNPPAYDSRELVDYV